MQRLTPYFLFAQFVLSLYVIAVFVSSSHYGWEGGHFMHTADGKPGIPLAYRVLIPQTISFLQTHSPDWLRFSLTNTLLEMHHTPLGKYLFPTNDPWNPRGISKENIYNTFVMSVVVYVTLIGFIVMLYRLADVLFPESRIYALLAPIFALIILPVFIRPFAYTYDFAELFFITLGLYYMLKERWRSLIICFFFACLNKDTSFYLLVFFVFHYYRRLKESVYYYLIGLLVLIYTAVKISLKIYFSNFLLGHKFQMAAFYSNLESMYRYDAMNLVWLFIFIYLFGYRWISKPLFLRNGMWMVAASFCGYLLFGGAGEYRGLYGCMPVLFLLLTHSVVSTIGLDSIQLFKNPRSKPSQTA
jgi:hypothetical protein